LKTEAAAPNRTSWCGLARLLLMVSGFVFLAGAGGVLAGTLGITDEVEEVFQFSLEPSSLSAAPGGDWIVGLSQRERPIQRAVRLTKAGEVIPFPTQADTTASPGALLPLDAVEAVKVGTDGVIWLLDNGRRTETVPRLIAWEVSKNRLHRILPLTAPAVKPGSFCAALALDPAAPFAYVADPASDQDAALVVVNLTTGLARRVLEGVVMVTPDPEAVIHPGTASVHQVTRIDGTSYLPHSGLHSLAMDRKGEWLYFAALRARAVYRVKASMLRDFGASEETLLKGVEQYAEIPPASSLAMDSKGNLYLGDVNARGIGMVESRGRAYSVLVADARLLWPNGLAFGNDGRLYFFSPRRQTTPPQSTLPGPAARPSSSLFRIRTPASGRAGD
jgi:hypothetical protein